MKTKFDSMVIVPVSTLVAFGMGMLAAGGGFPSDVIGSAITILVGAWIGVFIIDMIVRQAIDGILSALYYEPEKDKAEGSPGELTILLVRDGDVVGQMRSWDKPLDTGKREYWGKKLPKLLMRGIKKDAA